MPHELVDNFCWAALDGNSESALSDREKYQAAVDWASSARSQNPIAFDLVSKWVLDDSQWAVHRLPENRQILIGGVLGGFKAQNARLRAYLKGIKTDGVVNPAVWEALDRFDSELSGRSWDADMTGTLERMFADFSVMKSRDIRAQIAGGLTGASGTDTVESFGYINYLKEHDSRVQWALFMPQLVERQQNGFKLDSFEYRKMPAMRFIGAEGAADDGDISRVPGLMRVLDGLAEYRSGFDYDVMLVHHHGRGVDVEPPHCLFGRFMQAGAPVPDGFVCVDFAEPGDAGIAAGPPYLSQFAFASFSGDTNAMHSYEGTDGGAMYDVTRNIILGQNVNIPYPDKYWTAEVFLRGVENAGTAYMFSVEL